MHAAMLLLQRPWFGNDALFTTVLAFTAHRYLAKAAAVKHYNLLFSCSCSCQDQFTRKCLRSLQPTMQNCIFQVCNYHPDAHNTHARSAKKFAPHQSSIWLATIPSRLANFPPSKLQHKEQETLYNQATLSITQNKSTSSCICFTTKQHQTSSSNSIASPGQHQALASASSPRSAAG
jgi:hypothetical protein